MLHFILQFDRMVNTVGPERLPGELVRRQSDGNGAGNTDPGPESGIHAFAPQIDGGVTEGLVGIANALELERVEGVCGGIGNSALGHGYDGRIGASFQPDTGAELGRNASQCFGEEDRVSGVAADMTWREKILALLALEVSIGQAKLQVHAWLLEGE